MKRAVIKPLTLPHLRLSKIVRHLFVRQKVTTESKIADSIFSLACQRCAGFTTRPPKRKENDW